MHNTCCKAQEINLSIQLQREHDPPHVHGWSIQSWQDNSSQEGHLDFCGNTTHCQFVYTQNVGSFLLVIIFTNDLFTGLGQVTSHWLVVAVLPQIGVRQNKPEQYTLMSVLNLCNSLSVGSNLCNSVIAQKKKPLGRDQMFPKLCWSRIYSSRELQVRN